MSRPAVYSLLRQLYSYLVASQKYDENSLVIWVEDPSASVRHFNLFALPRGSVNNLYVCEEVGPGNNVLATYRTLGETMDIISGYRVIKVDLVVDGTVLSMLSFGS